MNAEFTSVPISGQYDERQFDLKTVWKSAEWCWVKFSFDNAIEWSGSFRGIAAANQLGLVGVLTTDCLYLINPSNYKMNLRS